MANPPNPNQPQKKRRFADKLVKETIMTQCAVAGTSGYTTPEAVARELYPEKWQTLLPRIRLFAHQMAQAGQIVIIRKGQIADPSEEVKGLIRLALPPETADEGNL